jgi:hypothetical protein
MADGVWFIYRTPYEGPTGTRVWRLPDRSVLGWFQRVWGATADEDHFDVESDAYQWVTQHLAAELGGDVYGLNSLFTPDPDRTKDPGRDRHCPLPASTWQELGDLLDRELYVEGDPEHNIRVDQHSVRAKTDDDEVDLAYFFVDDALLRSRPDCGAYLVWKNWRPLPPGRADRRGFQAPIPVRELGAVPGGTRTTYAVLFTLDGFGEPPPVAFSGVRLPQFAEYLQTVVPEQAEGHQGHGHWRCCWPCGLLALRTLIAPGERHLGPAFRRYNRWEPQLQTSHLIELMWRSGARNHAAAHAQIQPWLPQQPSAEERNRRDPARSRIHATQHLAQAAIHVDHPFGYERWYLFNDVRAAAHPDLAASLLRCAAAWTHSSPDRRSRHPPCRDRGCEHRPHSQGNSRTPLPKASDAQLSRQHQDPVR